jgi:ubiquinone/menaquinone biosynthesis C-methylase UbiE
MAESIHYSPAALNNSYGAPEIVKQRRVTLDVLAVQPGQNILDVGCGSGFLTYELANLVGSSGTVIAIDKSEEMIDATMERCFGLGQVSSRIADVRELPFDDNQFDAVTCTQVLLYVGDVAKAISELSRVTRGGGRVAILETDWRGAIMYSHHPELTDAIFTAWDKSVPSPNLPRRLSRLMHKAGINVTHKEAIPLLNTDFDPGNFSVSSLNWLSGNAYKKGAISKEQSALWRDDLEKLGELGEYFFCVNRFLFVGNKIQSF